MDVALLVVQPAPAAATARERHHDSSHLREAETQLLDDSACVTVVGCLQLVRLPAPPPEGPLTPSMSLSASQHNRWKVSVLLGEPDSLWDPTDAPSLSSAARFSHPTVASLGAAADAPLSHPPRKHLLSTSASAVVSSLHLCDTHGRPLPLTPSTPPAAPVQDALWRKLRRLITQCSLGDTTAQSHTSFFHGSAHTRRDALYLTVVHHLLASCATVDTSCEIDVSLVVFYEPWGLGDVLVADAPPHSSGGAVVWCPLHRSPAALDSAAAVRGRLREWFERVDSASAAWTQRPAAAASPLSLSAADRLSYLESSVVYCTLRLRNPAGAPTAAARYVSLVLLPDAMGSAGVRHGGNAARWRELEALRAFLMSFPDATSSRRRHMSAEWHTAALRRSRWLNVVATLHSSTGKRGEAGGDVATQAFLRAAQPSSFTWIGCVTADWADRHATRSTLSYLSPFCAPAVAVSSRHRKNASLAGRASLKTTRLAGDLSPFPHGRTSMDMAKEGGRYEDVSAQPTPSRPPAGVAHTPPSPPPPPPLPHEQENSSFVAERSASSSIRSRGRPTSVRDGDEETHSAHPIAVPLPSAAAAGNPVTRNAPCPVNTATREAEVRQLRHGVDSMQDRTPVAHDVSPLRGSSGPLRRYDASQPWTGAGGGPCLPPSVQGALADLRADPACSPALQAKLDVLMARVVEAYAAQPLLDTAEGTAVVSPPELNRYVAQLELKVALYEHRLALMDHYVTPTLARCADEIDHSLHRRQRK